jgi:PQQ-like domain
MGVFRGAASILIALATCAIAPLSGQSSVRLPEFAEQVPQAASRSDTVAWKIDVDSSTDWAQGDDVVAALADKRICGFSASSGRRRWCGGTGSGLAYASGTFAYVASHGGGVRGIDARSGRSLWHYDASGSTVESVWSAGAGFVVLKTANRFETTIALIEPTGRVRWTTRLSVSGPPMVAPPFLLVRAPGLPGNWFVLNLNAQKLGRTISVQPVLSIVDIRSQALTFVPDISDDIALRFITENVWHADPRTGIVRSRYRFAPDVDYNYAHESDLVPPGTIAPGPISVDRGSLYMAVGPRIYRYHFSEPGDQHPLLVSDHGTFIGRAQDGVVFVSRADGLWMLRPGATNIASRLISDRTVKDLVAADGQTAYFSFADRHVRAFSKADGRTMLDLSDCDGTRIALTPQSSLVACATARGAKIVGLRRLR